MPPPIVSSLTQALSLSASAMDAQRKRVLIISQNLACANTRPTHPEEDPYRRQQIHFKAVYDTKTRSPRINVVGISEDQSPFRKIFDPTDPASNDQGIVQEPNVNMIMEMSDLREAAHAHESEIRVFEQVLGMQQNAMSLIPGN